MPVLTEGSVSTFSDDTIVVQFTIVCENVMMREIERQRLEEWLSQLARVSGGDYGTIRRKRDGGVEYGDLE